VEGIVGDLAEATDDEEAQKRVEDVSDTAQRIKDREPAAGWPKLADLLGKDGGNVVAQFKIKLGLTINLAQLAEHKRLPLEYLQSLGLRDLDLGGVAIPYKDAGGKTLAVKERHALAAKDGSKWPKGERPLGYGEDRLGDATAAGYLVLVEGESDCWSLWRHDVPALGIPGADTVEQTLFSGYVSAIKTLFIFREPDAAGGDFVQNVADPLARLGWQGEAKVVTLDGIKDASDLHVKDPDNFAVAWEKAVGQATPLPAPATATSPPDPPLPQAPPWPDPLAEEAFHGLPGKIVRALEPASEADPVALLVQLLVAFGNAAGKSAHFTVESDRHHANEFVVLVGKTSKARKGTSWGRIESLMREAEEQWAAERVQTGLSSGEGLIWAVRDPITRRERVKDRGAVRDEDVEADPGVSDKRRLVVEPEFANVLKQTERQGNTRSAVLRVAWDGRDLRSMTTNNPARATGAHASLIGHIPATELQRYLTLTELANG
jgi:hypothetical protein